MGKPQTYAPMATGIAKALGGALAKVGSNSALDVGGIKSRMAAKSGGLPGAPEETADSIAQAGFGGLSRLKQMQLDKKAGVALGSGSPFAKVGSGGAGIGVHGALGLGGAVGGLGAVRKLGKDKDDAAKRKDETIGGTNTRLDEQRDLLKEQNTLLKQSLTVA